MNKSILITTMLVVLEGRAPGAPIRCAGTAARPLLMCDWAPDGALAFKLDITSTGPVGLGAFNYIPSLVADPLVSPSGYWKISFEQLTEVSAATGGVAPAAGAKVAAKGKVWHTFAPGRPAGHLTDVLESEKYPFELLIEANRVVARRRLSDDDPPDFKDHPDHLDRFVASLTGTSPADNPMQIGSWVLHLEGKHVNEAPEPDTLALITLGLGLIGLARVRRRSRP